MHIQVTSILPAPAALVWQTVQISALLVEVARPFITFAPVEPSQLPSKWQQGTTLRLQSRLLNVLPLGVRTLYFERVDDERREIQTREHDPLIRRWDHHIAVEAHGGEHTRYTDTLDIEAGILTIFVWLFAHWFFRHRHRRWQKVARRLYKLQSADYGKR